MPSAPFSINRRRLLAAVAAAASMSAPVTAAVRHRSMRHRLAQWPLPPGGGGLVGRAHVATVQPDETLHDVARRFDLGYWDMLLANPELDFWLPGDNRAVVLPRAFILPDAARRGIVINAAELRLYFYPADGTTVITHPIGIGRQNWATPAGDAKVVEKIPEPTWYPPASIRAEAAERGESLPRVVPPGPDNPLGAYALILDLPGYLIHGTHRPAGVGMRVSHGCVRLYPEDIAALFGLVERGMPVRIVNRPIKWAWADGRLWVEAHPLPGDDDYTAEHLRFSDRERRAYRERITAEALGRGQLPDRNRLEAVLAHPTGLPTPVTGSR